MTWKTKIPYRLIDFSTRLHPSDNYVIGVKRISDAGGAGSWVRIDENDNVVDVETNYFANHPTYDFQEVSIPIEKPSEILNDSTEETDNSENTDDSSETQENETLVSDGIVTDGSTGTSYDITNDTFELNGVTYIISGRTNSSTGNSSSSSSEEDIRDKLTWNNVFLKIPKFYIKSDGNVRFWIAPAPSSHLSDEEKEQEIETLIQKGFHVHPAFKSNGKEIDCFYVGKYQGYIHNNRMHSVPGDIYETDTEKSGHVKPTVYVTFEQCKEACEKWNTSSEEGAIQVDGYHMMNIHELSALQWLSLVEIGTTNAAMEVKDGGFGIGRLYGTTLYNVDDEKSELVDVINGSKTSAANFHGILGLWGNIWEFLDGIKVTSDNKLLIWDNDGRHIYKETNIEVPAKKRELESWVPGVTCGYYKSRLLTAGYNYDTSDLFIPDFTTLTPYYENGSYSDGVFGRVKSTYETKVCYGGGFDTGDYGGLYSYRFDIKQPAIKEVNGIDVDYGDNAGDIGARLCFAAINLKELS